MNHSEESETDMDIGLYLDLCEHAYNVAEMVVTGYLLYRFAKAFLNKSKYTAIVGVTYLAVMLILYSGYGILHIEGAAADAIAVTAVRHGTIYLVSAP